MGILSDIMGRAAAQRWTMLDMFISSRQGQGQGLCEGEPEAIFPGLYSSVLHSLAVVEPTFSLLLPDSICMLFNVCNQAQSELGLALQSSQVTEAWHAIHSPLQRMGQALFCSPPQSLDTKYWDYVLAYTVLYCTVLYFAVLYFITVCITTVHHLN